MPSFLLIPYIYTITVTHISYIHIYIYIYIYIYTMATPGPGRQTGKQDQRAIRGKSGVDLIDPGGVDGPMWPLLIIILPVVKGGGGVSPTLATS